MSDLQVIREHLEAGGVGLTRSEGLALLAEIDRLGGVIGSDYDEIRRFEEDIKYLNEKIDRLNARIVDMTAKATAHVKERDRLKAELAEMRLCAEVLTSDSDLVDQRAALVKQVEEFDVTYRWGWEIKDAILALIKGEAPDGRCPECAEPERHVLGVGFISSITQSVGAVNIKLRERSLPVPLPLPVWDISRYRIVLEKEDNDGN